MIRAGICTVILTLGVVPVVQGANGNGLLQRNPFSRSVEPVYSGGTATRGVNAQGGFELRGVLIDGDASIANIGGVIVPVGGEVNGYRLISVTSREATLERHGEQIRLMMEKE
jgi:hypothetical protein